MGLFFNTCPKCRRWVPRNATFCRYCGGANDTGWVRCWSCRTEISPASKFCYKCGADQKDQRATQLVDGRWPRQEGDVALRVETDELEGFLSKGLDIEQGTEAALFQHGRFAGVVGPGRYTVDSLLRKLVSLVRTAPSSILLYDAGDLELVVDTDGLRTSDGIQVSATYKVVLRVADAMSFTENLFKGRRVLSLPTLAERVSDELRGALKAAVVGRKLTDLFESPEARQSTEDALRSALSSVIARYGMTLQQLAFIDFFSPDYEALADKEGAVARAVREGDVDIERLKLTQRLRRAMTQDKMDSFSSGKELEDFVRQIEHELGMKGVIRADEMERLKARFGYERDKEGLVRRIELEAIQSGAAREEARKALLAAEERRATEHKGELERALGESKNEVEVARFKAEVRKTEMELDRLEAESAIAVRERTMAVQREHEREQLEMRSKATAEALLSITDGPAADRIARLAELERKEKLSPEQLFALAAAAEPEVARAYAREKGIKDYEEIMKRQEDLHKGYADRMERLMQTALEQMGRVAGPAPQAASPGGAGAQPCPKCSGMAAPGAAYCPHCGNKLR